MLIFSKNSLSGIKLEKYINTYSGKMEYFQFMQHDAKEGLQLLRLSEITSRNFHLN